MKILIVDDDPMNSKLVTKIISDMGHEFVQCFNGREALKLIDESQDINLVITDLLMPEINGFELSQEVKARYGHSMYVIAMSAGNEKLSKDVALSSFMLCTDDVIDKPIAKAALMDKIRIAEEALANFKSA